MKGKKKIKSARYRISPAFGTKYYGQPERAPKGWYETRAKTKTEAEKKFAKRFRVPVKWVKKSRIISSREFTWTPDGTWFKKGKHKT